MSDDKVLETGQKQPKNPKESAANAMREALAKDHDGKIKAQAKKVVDAVKILTNEKTLLNEMVADFEAEKATLNAALKEL